LGGQAIGQTASQTVVQTSSVQRTTEVNQTQQAVPSSRSGRQRRQRNESSSSSSSSDGAYKVSGAGASGGGQAGATSNQQFSAESNYASGGAVGGGSYAAAGDSFGSITSGQRRQGRYQKQVIRLPDQSQGTVRQVRRRLLTPEPDTLERV
jgi:hypothetical protein